MSDRDGDSGDTADGSFAAKPLTRRRFIERSAMLGAGAALSTRSGRLIEKALEGSSGVSGSLGDIEHIVVLMHENRSFDHMFGTMSGVRGFSDKNVPKQVVGGQTYPIFDQFGYNPSTQQPDPNAYLQPFHLL